MVGVGGGAVADELGADVGAARHRVLPLLEDEHAAALGHDEAVAARVERARGALRVVVARRQRARGAEAGDARAA